MVKFSSNDDLLLELTDEIDLALDEIADEKNPNVRLNHLKEICK